MKKGKFNQIPEVYTTGAFLRPLQVTDDKGSLIWIWYVNAFDGDNFFAIRIIFWEI